jgi:hypothetical protein
MKAQNRQESQIRSVMGRTKCMHTLGSAANSIFNLCKGKHLKTDMRSCGWSMYNSISSIQGKHPGTAANIYVTE